MKKVVQGFLFSLCFASFVQAQDSTKVKKEEVRVENQIEEVKIVKQKKRLSKNPTVLYLILRISRI